VVLIDLGCVFQGYNSDLTRTFFLGKINKLAKKIFEIVKEAQRKAISIIKDGVASKKVDFAARNFIKENGFEKYFIHGTGHGVGIDIHEEPLISAKSKTVLKAGMVVTVEPGIFSKMYFYLSSADGFAGAQVYASASEFPVLHIGQWVEVQGLTSRYYGVSRVRIRSKNDITIVRGQDPPTPVPVNSAKITDDYLGRLLVLKGNILKEEGKILLEDSSGSQLRLEIKEATGIKKEDLAEGDTCQIAGILDKTSGGFRLLPRYPGDIVKIASISDIASAQIADTQENGKVLGESVSSTGAFDQLNLSSASPVMQLPAEESNRPQVIKYLLVTLAAGVIVLAGLKIKTWRKSNYP